MVSCQRSHCNYSSDLILDKLSWFSFESIQLMVLPKSCIILNQPFQSCSYTAKANFPAKQVSARLFWHGGFSVHRLISFTSVGIITLVLVEMYCFCTHSPLAALA